LGDHVLSSRFPRIDESDPPRAPLVLVKCAGECGLLQLSTTVDNTELYTDSYGYRSGINESMQEHLRKLVGDITSICAPAAGDVVLDIGSNDGTLLSYYPSYTKRIGIDPTGIQFLKYYNSEIKLIPEFFSRDVFRKEMGEKNAKYVTSISMFYDLPDPLSFVKDVAGIMSEDGIWTMEQSYAPTMLENTLFDTICHEHLEYYCLKQIEWMVSRAGLRIINASLNECNGGSFRMFICHENADYKTDYKSIEKLRHKEINTSQMINIFVKECKEYKEKINETIHEILRKGETISIYGASTKGNTLLQFCGIDSTMIKNVAERNEMKYGCRTPGTNIPIISEDEVRKTHPSYMLVLPWHFRESIIDREGDYLKNGGKFIFPLPYIEIYQIRSVIACLTRGYTDLNDYDKLIERNKSIEKIIYDSRVFDVIIFHEGNISDEHKTYIQSFTPSMYIKFINIENEFDKSLVKISSKWTEWHEHCAIFNTGYRHMIRFWTGPFLKYLKDYEYIIRVDEDCILKEFPREIVDNMRKNKKVFITAMIEWEAHDAPGCILGFQHFCDEYGKKRGITPPLNTRQYPYNSVSISETKFFINSEIYQDFFNNIEESGGIYVNRWGDHAILGTFFANFVSRDVYDEDNRIKYYHGSHERHVN